jgi:hypothetical protein
MGQELTKEQIDWMLNLIDMLYMCREEGMTKPLPVS